MRGVTQDDPLSPAIVNVVVDAVVRHWVTLAVEEAEKRKERGKEVPGRPILRGQQHGSVVRPPLAKMGI